MPGLYAALAAFLAPAGRRPELVSTRPVEAPLPVSGPVLDLRAPGGMVGTLEDWRSALHEALAWTQPVPRGSIEDRVKAAANGLHVNMLWIAASWPAAGDLAQEIRDLHRDITSITNPPERGHRAGNCPALYNGVLCGAVLRLPQGGSVITCTWCKATYPPATWAGLRAAQPPLEEAS
ncbi:hypothetical protein ACIO6U_03855 [Streptomyces sp. NPDC087422]|uniref:hypothetical protein n=1 Tax=Streptomyces sp. NPDC087422 TaxID=3365786 RepID=UPI0038004071